MASESPEQTRANRRRYTLDELYEQEERRQQRRKPPMPPSDKGPERRNPQGVMDRALAQAFKNGGCVMAGRGGRFKGSM